MAAKSLRELVQWYDSYENNTHDARQASQRDRDYRDGKQWTSEEQAVLRARGQPCLTFNRIAPKINFVRGQEMRTRTDPKAHPRTPKDEQAAEVITDAIRFVCDENNFDQERSSFTEHVLVDGTGAFDVIVEPRGNELAIVVRHIPWDRLFWDPHSRFSDYRDGKFMGQVMWMDIDDAAEDWPQAQDVLDAARAKATATTNQTHDDRPHNWVDMHGSRVRVKIVQMYYRCPHDETGELTWYVATFNEAGFIEPPRVSPYLDEYGKPTPCLILQSAYTDRDNNRYGIVRDLISAQDEINKRRSKMLHALSVRQTIGEKGAVDDVRKMKQELAKSDGHIERNPGMELEIIQNPEMTQGHFLLLQHATQEMDAQGANAALTGTDPRSQSGIAIQSRQQGGLVELEPVFDGIRSATKRAYKAIYCRIKQFWTEEKWVRVTDDDNAPRFVGLNIPVTMAQMLQEQGQQIPPPQMLDPMTAMQLGQVVEVRNNVAEMNVDIIVDEAPDTVTLQQQQFEQLSQILPPLAAGIDPRVLLEVLVEASSLRNKRQLLERLKSGGATPEEQQAAAQAQQQAQAMAQQGAQLELEQKSADVSKTKAETVLKLSQAEKTTTDASMQRTQGPMQVMERQEQQRQRASLSARP